MHEVRVSRQTKRTEKQEFFRELKPSCNQMFTKDGGAYMLKIFTKTHIYCITTPYFFNNFSNYLIATRY